MTPLFKNMTSFSPRQYADLCFLRFFDRNSDYLLYKIFKA